MVDKRRPRQKAAPHPTGQDGQRRRPEDLVREGWNELSFVYRPARSRGDATGHLNTDYLTWLGPLMRELPKGSQVLDLGCGSGTPTARILASRFRVTGVDISEVQVRRARENVPKARFIRADMSAVRFPLGNFSAVVLLYSLIHVPVRKHRPLLQRIYHWLEPGGFLLAIVGKHAWTGREKGWLGSKTAMYWSHADAPTYERWLRELGFAVRARRYVPEGRSGHEMFLVQKPRRAHPTPNHRSKAVT